MIGANIAIWRDNKILLTKREDFEVWCLPGGHVDTGESFAEAAIREALEETGFQIKLSYLIGLYSRPQWLGGEYHIASFSAEIVGGHFSIQAEEVIEADFFGLDNLPSPFMVGHRDRILDAFSGRHGLVITETTQWPFSMQMSRQELYAKRDQSGLSRQAFYVKHFIDTPRHLDLDEPMV